MTTTSMATGAVGTGSASASGRLRTNLNLVRELSVTQFKLKYTGSILGYLWSLMKPLLIFGVMYAVFVAFLKVGNSSPHFPLQLLVGIVLWNFFAEGVGTAIGVIVGNASLLKKASFPRVILVVAASVTSLMTFVINMCLIVIIATPLGQVQPSLRSLMMLPLVVELYALILGVSLLLSALFTMYRDLGHIWEISSQVLFYGSAVVYPLSPSILGGKTALLALNPMAQIIEDARHALVTSHVPWAVDLTGPARFTIPILAVVAVLATGAVSFRRLAPRFAEYL